MFVHWHVSGGKRNKYPRSAQRRRIAMARAIARSRVSWGVWRFAARGATGLGDRRSASSSMGADDVALKRSVHAAGSPFLMSAMVRTPAPRARSPQRRRADQNNDRCLAEQMRCGDPPRRGWRSCPHHEHFASPGCTFVTSAASAMPRRASGRRARWCGSGRVHCRVGDLVVAHHGTLFRRLDRLERGIDVGEQHQDLAAHRHEPVRRSVTSVMAQVSVGARGNTSGPVGRLRRRTPTLPRRHR